MQRKNPLIWPLLLIGFVVIAGLIFLLSKHTASQVARINVAVSPASAVITINGQPAKSGENSVTATGSFEVVAKKSGFASISQFVTVKRGDNTYVGLILTPNGSATANWFYEHPSDEQISSEIISKQYDISSNQSAQSVPLIKKLPYLGTGLLYRVDYGVDPNHSSSTTPAIYITANTPQGRQNALYWITSEGYDLSQLKIVFINSQP